jgi:hypothetical protein
VHSRPTLGEEERNTLSPRQCSDSHANKTGLIKDNSCEMQQKERFLFRKKKSFFFIERRGVEKRGLVARFDCIQSSETSKNTFVEKEGASEK